MSTMLLVKTDAGITEKMNAAQFNRHPDGRFVLEEISLEEFEVGEPGLEGYRPVSVHLMPVRQIEGKTYCTIFESNTPLTPPTVYLSLPITQDDFRCLQSYDPDQQVMSLPVTIIARVSELLEGLEGKFGISLGKGSFTYPDVVGGEFVAVLNVGGDNLHVVDEWLNAMGTVIGHAPIDELTADPEGLNDLSIHILQEMQ